MLTPWLVVVGLFVLLRQLERWLHQHIFKVGWLLTKNSQTTTILYYTFFLPGVVLHEFVLWLAAGLLNVRADRAIVWPEKQEIGELRLNFVKLSKKAGPIKVAIISTAPPIVGMIAIEWIASNVFNIPAALNRMGSGTLSDVAAALGQLLETPDVWLWFYLAFTIANTMIPRNFHDLRGWWIILVIFAVILGVLFAIGAGSQLIANSAVPITNGLNLLAGTFAVIIALDILMTAILALIENTYERITGDSVTFRDGRMVAMRRSELQALRQQEAERARQRAGRRPALAAASGMPSIYKMALPIPGAPGKEPVTQLPAAVVTPAASAPTLAEKPAPSLIAGMTGEKAAPAASSPPSLKPVAATKPETRDEPKKSPLLSPTPSGKEIQEIEGMSAEEQPTPPPRSTPFAPLRTTAASKPDSGEEVPKHPAFSPLSPSDETSSESEPREKPSSPAARTSSFGPLRRTPVMKPESSDELEKRPTLSPMPPGDKPIPSPARTSPFTPLRGTPATKTDADEPSGKPPEELSFTSRSAGPFQPLRGAPGAKSDEESEERPVASRPAFPQRTGSLTPLKPGTLPAKPDDDQDDRPASTRGTFPGRTGPFTPLTPRSPLARPQIDEGEDVTYEDEDEESYEDLS